VVLCDEITRWIARDGAIPGLGSAAGENTEEMEMEKL